MSFILDALRKSENERQRQGSAEFAGVPVSRDSRTTPRWLWIVGLLLAINLAVLIGLLMRPEIAPSKSVGQSTSQPESATANDPPSFADRVAAAKTNTPAAQPDIEPAPTEFDEDTAVRPIVVTQNPANVDMSEVYPTFQEVVVSGAVTLPTLTIDIHVYSDVPADRFVFINMSKYQEGARLDDGPELREITPEGAVLRHNGVTFLLPRE